MADIDRETVKRVAYLSRMGIRDEEIDQFAKELGKITAFVEELQDVDTDGVEPVGHITGLSNSGREDTDTKPLPAQDHDLLEEQAPGHVDGEVRVPRILS